MKTLLLILSLTLVGSAVAQMPQEKPDYFTYNADGSVKSRGTYQTDENGRVVKFTVFDSSGQLIYTEIPYYANDGRIVRGDHFDADGKLQKVVVYFDRFAKVMDATGNVIDTQGFSQREFLERSK